ncbi:SDR family NAD(P)-dependent oxidoreductase [Aquimarina aggregata]|uniref:SDR family NAD(P)-dependent oxidoreductase n=1 Tax=Aquimarina aggregata TaxID=1642818 RepID=UPI00248F4770|nr:SDR family NAD(P)-dependent oxidoreductase [Aquimarina aggregata]
MSNKDKSGIDPTIFYNYSTLEKLSEYLVSEFSEEIIQKHDVSDNAKDTFLENEESFEDTMPPEDNSAKRFPEQDDDSKETVAIVGVSGKYPGADSLTAFWENLEEGKDAITEVPKDRWDWKKYYGDPNKKAGKTKAKWGGFLDDLDKFDAPFFNISPKEAELMDPQHRLCLESVWSALEDAGIPSEALSGTSAGVFIGVSGSDYLSILQQSGHGVQAQAATGVAHSLLVNRISYLLNIHGPSEPIDTACSSSLVAIHRAVENIQSGRCSIAIAGGVNAILSPMVTQALSKAGVMSDHGRCKTFDEDANGYVRSEGVGTVILKPLSKAKADGDYIYAIIKGTAENHGGKANSLTAPNPKAQTELLIDVYEKSNVAPDSISYIETHGTGTSLGDPVEMNALKQAFETLYARTDKKIKTQSCGIGSVKTNIGHLESAAGIASLTKVLLAMKHHTLPANVHFKKENPYLKLGESPFYVVQNTQPWISNQPLRAGISSFGFGGSNAHIILEEYPSEKTLSSKNETAQLIAFSAKNKTQLKERAEQLVLFLNRNKENSDINLRDVSWTLQKGRSEMTERMAFVVASLEELENKLQEYLKATSEALDVFEGNTKEKSGIGDVLDQEEVQTLLSHALQSKKLDRIAKLWVSGVAIDWDVLHKGSTPQKINLPTYPFAKSRYWVTISDENQLHTSEYLHPIIHRNTSDIHSLQYTSVFSGTEDWFIRDNIEFATLSPLGYHQMATTAAMLSGHKELNSIQNFVFGTPFLIENTSKEISIELYQESEGCLSFEIYSDEEVVHAKGELYATETPENSILQIQEIQDRLIEKEVDTTDDTLFFSPQWELADVKNDKEASEHIGILLCGKITVIAESFTDNIRNHFNKVNVHKLDEEKTALFHKVLALIQDAFKTKKTSQCMVLVDESEWEQYGFLSGLFKTATTENPLFTGKIISIENSASLPVDTLINIVREESLNSQDEIKYSLQGRAFKNIVPIVLEENANSLIKDDGIYIITGGLGGLGYTIAQEIASTASVQMILTGRSKLTKAKKKKLKTLPNAVYKQCDIAVTEEVITLVKEIKKEYGKVNGIVHCAGVGTAALIPNIDNDYANQVMLPKMQGVDNLDVACASEPLDFMVFYSSISSVFGIQGLADYAAANTYMDNYAMQRNALVDQGKRFGKTISINWPFWDEGGMQTQEENLKALYYRFGTKSLPSNEGVASFKKILASSASQVLVVYGDVDMLKNKLHKNRKTYKTPTTVAINEEELKEEVTKALINDIQKILKISKENIAEDIEFGEFGFDSITMTEFSNSINHRYDVGLVPTVFYNYPNVTLLSEHLMNSYLLELKEAHQDVSSKNNEVLQGTKKSENQLKRRIKSFRNNNASQEAVAIIGVSGRYPGSPDIDTFWDHIIEGKDLISEVPKERWDWKEIYGEPTVTQNKTKAKWGGFLNDIDKFDSLFFNISPLEAELMDPQQRLCIEAVWTALEDAVIAPQNLSGTNTGIFIGVSGSDYLSVLKQSGLDTDAQAPTGSAHSILTNRISYLLNIHGPSEPIDTACSSSLIAMHRAVENINSGNCDIAIAGGVNIILSPTGVLSLSKAGMLSEDGRCKTFDASADGYVRGEGVGMMVLKSLKQAEKDGDRIYGVIRGTAQNHGGKANTLTSPNPNAQTKLLIDAYSKSKIAPESVSYIEAHGTGTGLGDPVEIEGLKGAFLKLLENSNQEHKEPFCGVSSVKTNIGHLESASGIAGVTTVLLAMKNKELPGNIHLKNENPYLQLTDSPFYLLKENKSWQAATPLRAGVSSFGYGGTNAHIILEEYVATPKEKEYSLSNVIIPISAKTSERLKVYVQNIFEYIHNSSESFNVYDIAWTMQIGRDALEERLAIVTNDVQDLVEKLQMFLSETKCVSDVYQGSTKRHKPSKKESSELQKAEKDNDVNVLAMLWVAGETVSWRKLYVSEQPEKIKFPTYPFAKERHWITPKETEKTYADLHPLVHQNISDFEKYVYSAKFTGNETILKDHIVNGHKVFPGVGYIEMARASGALASGKRIRAVRDISWSSPMLVASDTEVSIELTPEGETIQYEISSNNNEVLHSSGILSAEILEGDTSKINIQQLLERCNQHIHGAECYTIFEKLGLTYGESFQNIKDLYSNENECVSLLKVSEKSDEYGLIPELLDAAFQTTLGLSLGKKETSNNLELPFRVEEVNLYNPLEDEVYCYVQLAKGETSTTRTKAYDIDIVTLSGDVLVTIRNFMVLNDPSIKLTDEGQPELVSLASIWGEPQTDILGQDMNLDKEILICVDVKESQLIEISKHYEGEVISYNELAPIELFNTIFNRVQDAFSEKESTQITVLGDDKNFKSFGFISGLLKTVHIENPTFKGKIISVSSLSEISVVQLLSILEKEKTDPYIEVRYTGLNSELRQVREIQEIKKHKKKYTEFIESHKVYLITGGTGAIGRLVAEHILETKDAKVIISGRSALKTSVADWIEANQNLTYIKCDLSDISAVENLYKTIKDSFGALHGVIHSAGVVRDNFIIKKTVEEATSVLSPKIVGVENLDKVMQQEQLDFMIYFSSLSSITGNIGQADYAAANGYMNAYASYRNELVKEGKRKGKTISINWPYWENGGMQINKENLQLMHDELGFSPLPNHKGLEALLAVFNLGIENAIIGFGNSKKILNYLKTASYHLIENTNSTSEYQGDDIIDKQKAQDFLKNWLSKELKLEVEKIHHEDRFEEYGIDSVVILKLTNSLEKIFGKISKTLFFEYFNIATLADYFIQNHKETLDCLIEDDKDVKSKIENNRLSLDDIANNKIIEVPKAQQNDLTTVSSQNNDNDIAVIGLSSKYPGADTTEAFWENLKNGIDSITEIPSDRWDIQKLFDPEKQKDGKIYCKWGGFINGVDEFDSLFFNISPTEARSMEPQERLFLQNVWETIEDAGYTKKSLLKATKGKKDIGVFVGALYQEYQLYGAEETLKGNPLTLPGSSASIANRVSFIFDFQGPSMALDTMCSSSLTSIHLACEAIQNGSCIMAVAGGVNISIHPNKYLVLSQGGFISPTGKCRSFGQEGDGYVPSEGIGSILLKPLAQAEKDGDHIYAVIKGSALGHGGKTNGYTVPNPDAQANVVREALEQAKVAPEHITYIEAHGTGTLLGDPIEIAGLSKALKTDSNKKYCKIGSVKSNIGHTEASAGIAGLTKVILQMQHKQIAPSLYSEKINENIAIDNIPFEVQQNLENWETIKSKENGKEIEVPRIAGISGFGAGGANAHLIVQEYIDTRIDAANQFKEGPVLIPLSARNKNGLKNYAEKLLAFLSKENDSNEAEARINNSIKNILSTLMNIPLEELVDTEDFNELGVDQLLLSTLSQELGDKLKIVLSEKSVIESKNIVDLSKRLLAEYPALSLEEDTTEWSIIKLHQIARTLQIGREPLKERLVIIANDFVTLKRKLENYLAGNFEDIYVGKIDQNNRNAVPQEISDLKENEIGEKEYEILAALWIQGYKMDWDICYPKDKPKKISLPTYPFEKKKHWFTKTSNDVVLNNGKTQSGLIARMSPQSLDYDGLVYEIPLDKNMPLLVAHKVAGTPVFPGVGYMQIVFEALQEVFPDKGIQIKDHFWLQTFEVTNKRDLKLRLVKQQNGISYQFVGEDKDSIFAQGKAVVLDKIAVPRNLDVPKLQQSLSPIVSNTREKAVFYQQFDEQSIQYGDYFKRVDKLWSNGNEALGFITLTDTYKDDLSTYILPPVLLDAALHCFAGLDKDATGTTFLPFRLSGLLLYKALEANIFCHVKKISDESYQLHLYNEKGQLLMTCQDFGFRALKKPKKQDFTFLPHWKRSKLITQNQIPENQKVLLVHDDTSSSFYETMSEMLKASKNIVEVVKHTGQQNKIVIPDGLDEIYLLQNIDTREDDSYQISAVRNNQELKEFASFRLLKDLLVNGYGGKTLKITVVTQNCQSVHTNETVDAYGAGLIGLVSAATMEFPSWQTRLIDITASHNQDINQHYKLIHRIWEEPYSNVQEKQVIPVVAFREKLRYQRKLVPVVIPEVQSNKLRQKGVYVIFGGAGGLGEVTTKYLIEKYDAQVVWIGRREIDSAIKNKQEKLKNIGEAPVYLQADIVDQESIAKAYQQIKSRFNQVNGIFHSALVLKDKSMHHMDENTFRASFDVKAIGTHIIAKVFEEEHLDFLCFYSSTQSFFPSPGQANYASGCTYMDSLAYELLSEKGIPIHIINWGYWANVGVVTDEKYRQKMKKLGIGSMEEEEGMQLLEQVLAHNITQVYAIKMSDKVKELLGISNDAVITIKPSVKNKEVLVY